MGLNVAELKTGVVVATLHTDKLVQELSDLLVEWIATVLCV
jgi:hypothetical protein